MNGHQLKKAAILLYGERGWQVKLAEDLRRNVSSVRRWTSGQVPVPGPVQAAVWGFLEKQDPIPPA